MARHRVHRPHPFDAFLLAIDGEANAVLLHRQRGHAGTPAKLLGRETLASGGRACDSATAGIARASNISSNASPTAYPAQSASAAVGVVRVGLVVHADFAYTWSGAEKSCLPVFRQNHA